MALSETGKYRNRRRVVYKTRDLQKTVDTEPNICTCRVDAKRRHFIREERTMDRKSIMG